MSVAEKPAAVAPGPPATAAPVQTAAIPAKPSPTGPAPAAPVPATAAAPKPAAPASPSLETPEAALTLARSQLGAGKVQEALDALDRLMVLAPGGTDEALVLYGRSLEKTGPQKDIKRAYAYYRKLRDEYPESAFWDEASARASYIERHYFDIR